MPELKARYVRKSFCGCGFPVLKETVPMGTVYDVHAIDDIAATTYKCGCCGGEQVIKCASVSRPGMDQGWIPLDILEIYEQPSEQPTESNN